MALSDILIRINADSSAFQAEMSATNKALNQVFQASSRASSGFAALGARLTSVGSALTMSITGPLVGFGAATVKVAADMEALRSGLAATTKDAGPLEKQLQRLQDVAKLPGLGFKEAIQGSTALQAAGFSATLAERSLKAFGNALATVGKGKDDLDGVTLALSQIASKGKISAEEINQLAERVPQIRVAIKDAFGTADTEVLQKAGISAEEFVTKVVAQLEKLKQVTGGTKNSFENLSDTLTQAGDRIGQKLLPTVNEMIPKIERLITLGADLSDQFVKLPEPVQNIALALVGFVAASGPVSYAIGKIISAAGTLRLGLAALATGISAVGVASAAAGAGVGIFLKWLIDNGKKPVDTTAEAIDNLKKKYDGQTISTGAASDMLVGYMRAIGQATPAVKEHGEEFARATTAIETHAKAMESAKLPSADILALFERVRDAAKQKQEQVANLADIMQRYSVVTAAAAIRAAKALDLLFVSYRQLSDAPNLGGLTTDFSKLPKAPGAELPGPSSFEEFVKSGKNIGPEGMLTKEQAEAIKARAKDVGRSIRQVSTIATDLSRGIANAGVGLLFSRGAQVDVQKYKDEISQLEAEQRKLLASQAKGNDVSELLRANTAKLAAVNKEMGDAVYKASFGFRALEAGKSIVADLAKSITRVLIEGALENLGKKLLNVGGIFGKVFGGMGGGGGTIFSNNAGSAASGATGASGGAGGAMSAGGGLTGMIGAVASVGTLISSIVGNFQMAKQETTLNAIEHEVRYSQIHLLNTLNKANEFWPYMKGCWESLVRMETAQQSLMAGGGGGSITVSMAGAYLMSDVQMADFADRFARFLKARGA